MRLSWRATNVMATNGLAARAIAFAKVRPFATTADKHQSYVRRLRVPGGLSG